MIIFNPRRQHFWDRWLTFSSPVGKYRLAPVPDGWPTSSPELLARWLANARLAAESRRGAATAMATAPAPRPLASERSGRTTPTKADGEDGRPPVWARTGEQRNRSIGIKEIKERRI